MALDKAELREEIDLGRLYFEYRRYVFNDNGPKSAKTQLEVLTNYSIHYKALVDGSGDTPIAKFGRRISLFDITTLHPLALTIGVAPLTTESKDEMLNTIVSYVVRRAICGLTPKNYNNIFISILRNLHRSGISPETLRQSFTALKGEASRWPSDAEFRNACINTPIYPGKLESPKMRAILAELELELRQTRRTEDAFLQNLDHLDIDHILPQSWFEHWPLFNESKASSEEAYRVTLKRFTGESLNERERAIMVRVESIQTLGNLTLLNLSVNREAQHKSFDVKKKLLLANTNLRLNIPLLAHDSCTEETIKKRGEELAEMALRVWPGI